MFKRYLIDSSVFLNSPHALFAFEDNQVLIPACVIREIGERTRASGEIRANAVEFTQLLDSIYEVPGEIVPLSNGGAIEIVGELDDNIYSLANEYDAIIVSRDATVRLTARAMSIRAEPFKAEQLVQSSVPYEGRCSLYISPSEMSAFARTKELRLNADKLYSATSAKGECLPEDYTLTVNEYVTLVNIECPQSGTMLGRFDGEKIVPLRFYSKDHPVFGVTARNVGQIFALDALMNPDAPLVILQGPAGTAKTFLSMAAALEQTYCGDTYRRILITRPNAKMDADVGFLKGDEKQKVLPTLRGLLDNVDNLMMDDTPGRKDGKLCESPLDTLLSNGVIEAQAMAYMRGRSICRQFMIVDEMQNSTINQVLSIITRIGEQSKIVLLGDPHQIDNPYLDRMSNGLVYAAEKMRGSPLCWQLTFTDDESTRSPLAKEAIARLTPKGGSSGYVG